MLKRHTPSLESVWAEWEREKRAAKRRAARGPQPERRRTPDNSEPWLKHPPRTIGDLFYISDKVAEVAAKISTCSLPEATRLFSRYPHQVTCEASLTNPNPAVREMGLAGLRELAADGNPFAIAALRKVE